MDFPPKQAEDQLTNRTVPISTPGPGLSTFTMHRQSIARLARQYGGFPLVDLPPPYLAPSLHFSINRSPTQCSNFSSSSAVAAGRDKSKNRGVSAIHRTGPKHPLGVSKYPLPKPAAPERAKRSDLNPKHGLWGFFPTTREALSSPEYDNAHGQFAVDAMEHGNYF